MSQSALQVKDEDLEEDCRTLLGIASMAVEMKAVDRAILIADKVASASPALREAHFASVLFRLLDGQVEEAVVGAQAVREKFPQWTTARILNALADKAAGGSVWSEELEAVINESEDETDIEFARALLNL